MTALEIDNRGRVQEVPNWDDPSKNIEHIEGIWEQITKMKASQSD